MDKWQVESIAIATNIRDIDPSRVNIFEVYTYKILLSNKIGAMR